MPWWKAYNALKHDRIRNRREGTLQYAVESLAALFLAILYCDVCHHSLSTSGWLQSPNVNAAAHLDDHLNPHPGLFLSAETKLFSYPIGWMAEPFPSGGDWIGPASERFKFWFRDQCG